MIIFTYVNMYQQIILYLMYVRISLCPYPSQKINIGSSPNHVVSVVQRKPVEPKLSQLELPKKKKYKVQIQFKAVKKVIF